MVWLVVRQAHCLRRNLPYWAEVGRKVHADMALNLLFIQEFFESFIRSPRPSLPRWV
jgi:hypothetical protein